MNIQVEINPPRVDFQQLRALLSDSGWGSADCYTDAVLEKTIKGCSYFVVAHETNTILGYARAFTDDIMVTWIAELLVSPERRRQGIGTLIMNELLRVTSHTAIYTEAFVGNEDFLYRSISNQKQSSLPVLASRSQQKSCLPLTHHKTLRTARARMESRRTSSSHAKFLRSFFSNL